METGVMYYLRGVGGLARRSPGRRRSPLLAAHEKTPELVTVRPRTDEFTAEGFAAPWRGQDFTLWGVLGPSGALGAGRTNAPSEDGASRWIVEQWYAR